MRYLRPILVCAALATFIQASARGQVESSGPPAVQAQVQTFETSAGPVKITPIYHACVRIEAGGKTIYIDPARPYVFTGLPPGDLILISHVHGDHMDPEAVKALSKSGTEVWAPAAVAKTITQASVISNGDTKTWDGWTIEAVEMYNLTRGPKPGELYHPKGLGNGYVLTYGGKRFYFSGDTENVPELHDLKNIDVAFVCMNLPNTMSPDEAAEFVKTFHPKIAIPYHYRNSDISVFQKDLQGTGIEVRLLNFYPYTPTKVAAAQATP